MRLELDATHFDGGVGVFDVGCVLLDTESKAEIEIIKFSGFSEIDDLSGAEQQSVIVHFSDDSAMTFDSLDRETIKEGKFEPVRPDWFVSEVKSHRFENVDEDTDTDTAEAEPEPTEPSQPTKKKAKQLEMFNLRDVKAEILPVRPVEAYTNSELFAKVAGAPLSVAEDLLTTYEANLARMAASSPKQMQKIAGIGTARAEKIIAAFELAKRLARFHAEKPKITSPSDVADLLMSKMRYLKHEIVCVLALNTKGSVTTEGVITGELGDGLTWGKMIAEETIFEGTLNASVFHPREIFRFAIEESANSIVLSHNHPSGDPQPSSEDIRATKQLMEAGEHIGIKVLDHIVIGDGIFVSLKEEGFMEKQ